MLRELFGGLFELVIEIFGAELFDHQGLVAAVIGGMLFVAIIVAAIAVSIKRTPEPCRSRSTRRVKFPWGS